MQNAALSDPVASWERPAATNVLFEFVGQFLGMRFQIERFQQPCEKNKRDELIVADLEFADPTEVPHAMT